MQGSIKSMKTENPEFLKTLCNYHVVCLQETIKPVAIPGYRSFCNIRKGKSVNHGGVCTLVRNDLSEGVRRINNITESSDFVILKISKSALKMKRDIYIINLYISPKNSSWSLKRDYEPFEELSRVLDTLAKRDDGDLILAGDFNSRIGELDDFLTDDKLATFVDIPSDVNNSINLKQRNSLDKHSNSYKNEFLDFIIGYKLIILNGRTIGDIYGDYTCVKWNGCSLIDYGIISQDLAKSIISFRVLKFTEFSDHKPIEITIKADVTSKVPDNTQKYPFCHKRFIMTDEGKLLLTESQKSDEYKEIINDILTSDYSDVNTLNKNITDSLVNLADVSFKSTKPWRIKDCKGDKPWVDGSCKEAKKGLNKALRILNNNNNSDFIRKRYYSVKKRYFRHLNSKRSKYMSDLNSKIEHGKVLDWKAFKKLSTSNSQEQKFDNGDVTTFSTFFTELYADKHTTLTANQKENFMQDALRINTETQHAPETEQLLNGDISMEELIFGISQLNTGKSASDDLISNDILKLLSVDSKLAVLKLFNLCLANGVYPWHNSVVTPLLKKGDRKNPDNYRAIAVGSCLGKLFSSIILERITTYRHSHCPDPPNQMGFRKNAQTIDHILTIRTILEKYKKLKKKVYCVFVDLKKAFDTVPRQALLFKLAHMGITGRVFDVVRDMYVSSTMQLKMGNVLSNTIKVQKGTEQGHTLSPEFFKCYLNDLTPLLDSPDVPELSNMLISHLLWADDLVLMGLNLKTAQHLLDTFQKFCVDWGLEINIAKSSLIIFNKKSLKNNSDFVYLGNSALDTVDSYTYLGIKLHMSGSMNFAMQDLYKKAMRANNALRMYLDRSRVSVKATIKLFDTLIKPILMYGAPIWTPNLNVVKNFIDYENIQSDTTPKRRQEITASLHRKLSNISAEKLHLRYLKWCLGVHKYSSNSACWNELARLPLLCSFMKQTLAYADRIEDLPDTALVKRAWLDQKLLQLPWYTATYAMTGYSGDQPVMTKFKSTFSEIWKSHLQKQSKLDFYRSVTQDYNDEPEEYLSAIKNFKHRSRLTRIRISAHRLAIETGRYINLKREDRICCLCDTNKVEDEAHFLLCCPALADERAPIIDKLVDDDIIDKDAPLQQTDPRLIVNHLEDHATNGIRIRLIAKQIHLMLEKRTSLREIN